MVFLATKAAVAATIVGIGVTFGALSYLARHRQENGGAGLRNFNGNGSFGGGSGNGGFPVFPISFQSQDSQSLSTLPRLNLQRFFGGTRAPSTDCNCKLIYDCSTFFGGASQSFRFRRTCGFQGFQRKICCDEGPFFSTPPPNLALDDVKTAHAQLSGSGCNHALEGHSATKCNCDEHRHLFDDHPSNNNEGSQPEGSLRSIAGGISTETVRIGDSSTLNPPGLDEFVQDEEEGPATSTEEPKRKKISFPDLKEYFRDDKPDENEYQSTFLPVPSDDEDGEGSVARIDNAFEEDRKPAAESSTPKDNKFPDLNEFFPDGEGSDPSFKLARTTMKSLPSSEGEMTSKAVELTTISSSSTSLVPEDVGVPDASEVPVTSISPSQEDETTTQSPPEVSIMPTAPPVPEVEITSKYVEETTTSPPPPPVPESATTSKAPDVTTTPISPSSILNEAPTLIPTGRKVADVEAPSLEPEPSTTTQLPTSSELQQEFPNVTETIIHGSRKGTALPQSLQFELDLVSNKPEEDSSSSIQTSTSTSVSTSISKRTEKVTNTTSGPTVGESEGGMELATAIPSTMPSTSTDGGTTIAPSNDAEEMQTESSTVPSTTVSSERQPFALSDGLGGETTTSSNPILSEVTPTSENEIEQTTQVPQAQDDFQTTPAVITTTANKPSSEDAITNEIQATTEAVKDPEAMPISSERNVEEVSTTASPSTSEIPTTTIGTGNSVSDDDTPTTTMTSEAITEAIELPQARVVTPGRSIISDHHFSRNAELEDADVRTLPQDAMTLPSSSTTPSSTTMNGEEFTMLGKLSEEGSGMGDKSQQSEDTPTSAPSSTSMESLEPDATSSARTTDEISTMPSYQDDSQDDEASLPSLNSEPEANSTTTEEPTKASEDYTAAPTESSILNDIMSMFSQMTTVPSEESDQNNPTTTSTESPLPSTTTPPSHETTTVENIAGTLRIIEVSMTTPTPRMDETVAESRDGNKIARPTSTFPPEEVFSADDEGKSTTATAESDVVSTTTESFSETPAKDPKSSLEMPNFKPEVDVATSTTAASIQDDVDEEIGMTTTKLVSAMDDDDDEATDSSLAPSYSTTDSNLEKRRMESEISTTEASAPIMDEEETSTTNLFRVEEIREQNDSTSIPISNSVQKSNDEEDDDDVTTLMKITNSKSTTTEVSDEYLKMSDGDMTEVTTTEAGHRETTSFSSKSSDGTTTEKSEEFLDRNGLDNLESPTSTASNPLEVEEMIAETTTIVPAASSLKLNQVGNEFVYTPTTFTSLGRESTTTSTPTTPMSTLESTSSHGPYPDPILADTTPTGIEDITTNANIETASADEEAMAEVHQSTTTEVGQSETTFSSRKLEHLPTTERLKESPSEMNDEATVSSSDITTTSNPVEATSEATTFHSAASNLEVDFKSDFTTTTMNSFGGDGASSTLKEDEIVTTTEQEPEGTTDSSNVRDEETTMSSTAAPTTTPFSLEGWSTTYESVALDDSDMMEMTTMGEDEKGAAPSSSRPPPSTTAVPTPTTESPESDSGTTTEFSSSSTENEADFESTTKAEAFKAKGIEVTTNVIISSTLDSAMSRMLETTTEEPEIESSTIVASGLEDETSKSTTESDGLPSTTSMSLAMAGNSTEYESDLETTTNNPAALEAKGIEVTTNLIDASSSSLNSAMSRILEMTTTEEPMMVEASTTQSLEGAMEDEIRIPTTTDLPMETGDDSIPTTSSPPIPVEESELMLSGSTQATAATETSTLSGMDEEMTTPDMDMETTTEPFELPQSRRFPSRIPASSILITDDKPLAIINATTEGYQPIQNVSSSIEEAEGIEVTTLGLEIDISTATTSPEEENVTSMEEEILPSNNTRESTNMEETTIDSTTQFEEMTVTPSPNETHAVYGATTDFPDEAEEEVSLPSSDSAQTEFPSQSSSFTTTDKSVDFDEEDGPVTEITKSIRREPDTDKTIVQLTSMTSTVRTRTKVRKTVNAIRSGSEASVSELTTESPSTTERFTTEKDNFMDQMTTEAGGVTEVTTEVRSKNNEGIEQTTENGSGMEMLSNIVSSEDTTPQEMAPIERGGLQNQDGSEKEMQIQTTEENNYQDDSFQPTTETEVVMDEELMSNSTENDTDYFSQTTPEGMTLVQENTTENDTTEESSSRMQISTESDILPETTSKEINKEDEKEDKLEQTTEGGIGMDNVQSDLPQQTTEVSSSTAGSLQEKADENAASSTETFEPEVTKEPGLDTEAETTEMESSSTSPTLELDEMEVNGENLTDVTEATSLPISLEVRHSGIVLDLKTESTTEPPITSVTTTETPFITQSSATSVTSTEALFTVESTTESNNMEFGMTSTEFTPKSESDDQGHSETTEETGTSTVIPNSEGNMTVDPQSDEVLDFDVQDASTPTSEDITEGTTAGSISDEEYSSSALAEVYDAIFGPSGRSAKVNNLGESGKSLSTTFTSTTPEHRTTTTPPPPFHLEVKIGPHDARSLFSSVPTDDERQLEGAISNVVSQLLLTTHKNFHLLPNFIECAGARGRTGRRKTKVLHFDTDNYPWMARIGFREPRGILFPCAGTIISRRYILTSAHCATRMPSDSSKMEILLEGAKLAARGMSETQQSQYKYTVEDVIIHQNYDKTTRENDLALIRLSKEIPQFNGSSEVKPICLPFEDGYGVWDSLPSEGETAYLGGWGYGLKNMAAKVEEMEEAAVTIWPNANCSHSYRGDHQKKITPQHICAYGQEKDACRGDSGGPLMALMTRQRIFFQIGIVSYGPRCGYGVPGVYTKVSEYLSWILDSMRA